jgi:hypothetical protein
MAASAALILAFTGIVAGVFSVFSIVTLVVVS